MSRLHTTVAARRAARLQRRAERDYTRALAAAPTIESAHEIATLRTRR
jgi:hypothetical protein